MYSYKLMSLFSLTIFVGIMLFYYLLMIIIDDYSIFTETDLYIYISTLLESFGTFAYFVFPLVIIGAVILFICNFVLYFKGGRSLSNLAGVGISAILIILTLLGSNVYDILEMFSFNVHSPLGYHVVLFFENIIFILVAYIECMLTGSFICTIRAARYVPKYDKDYMIILGCYSGNGINLPIVLRNRVERALAFSHTQEEENGLKLKFILSGGQGNDEMTSEAEAMRRYLVSNGVHNKYIILEDESKNTRQNFKFSKRLINDRDAKVVFATTGYHVFRSGVLARQVGLYAEGVGSKSKWFFYIPASIREFIAEIVSEKWRHLFNILSINVAVILLLMFSYFNNI